jgi:site-specific DNA-cytosine methylase
MGQIGNAAPVPLAELMAGEIAQRLRGTLAVAHEGS